MERATTAIVQDDLNQVKNLLQAGRELVTRQFQSDQLYRDGIFHWIYAGDTLLHLAAAGYRRAIIQLLLAEGADPNAADNRRRSTPLHYASDGCISGPCWNAQNQVETIKTLLKHGARIDLPDANGATALHRAVRTRSAAAVQALLRAGSDSLRKNKPGSTPFHLAVQNTGRGGSGTPEAVQAQREIIRTFLSVGLKPDLKNSAGKTVIQSTQSEWARAMLCE